MAGITSSFSTKPVASGLISSRGSLSWIDRPTASITSGSSASARRCRPPPIHCGGCSGISVRPNSSAHSGGNFSMRTMTWRRLGGVSPVKRASTYRPKVDSSTKVPNWSYTTAYGSASSPSSARTIG